jgi:hypothetical protein
MNLGDKDRFFVNHATSVFEIFFFMRVLIHVLCVAPLVMVLVKKNITKEEDL